MNKKPFLSRLGEFFNLMPDKEDEAEVVAQISAGVSFRGANLWVLIFAILIASLGLNVNSTAVIIGAMLISPLMGPIIGMGMAAGISDIDLLKRSAKNYTVATVISIITATIYFLLTPIDDAGSELLARTWPTLYDVLIAFCGGAAGIIALTTRGKGNVIPGVAIATALMPPLCTAGFGLATGHWAYFFGAFYLFFINSVFIAAATFAGTRLLQFTPRKFLSPTAARRARSAITAIIVLTLIPAVLMTASIVQKSIFDRNVNNFVKTQLSQHGTRIISTEANADRHRLSIIAVGREITAEQQEKAGQQLANYGLEDYQLVVIQGAQTDSLLKLNRQMRSARDNATASTRQISELEAENAALNTQLAPYVNLRQATPEIAREAAALFPQVKSIAIGHAERYQATDTTNATTPFISVIVTTATGRALPEADRNKLQSWLRQRLKPDSVAVLYQTP